MDYSVDGPSTSVPGLTTANIYWSATTLAIVTSDAWAVDFNSGAVMSISGKSDGTYARAVRSDSD